MVSRVVFDAEIRRLFGAMVDPQSGLESQGRGRRVEFNESNTVAERVMYPTDIDRCRRNNKAAFEQPLVETVSGSEHELMYAWHDRIAVSVLCRVLHGKNRHDRSIASRS
jgi:hypothetical protein